MYKSKNNNPAPKNLLTHLLKRKQVVAQKLPFVSVVCPSYNRRGFLPFLLYMYIYQDYPADLRELIILDDSDQSNEDVVSAMVDKTKHQVRYIHSAERISLGQKRNMLNELSKGDYIICFDDDDYYPPEKISFQVNEMMQNNALFSGSDQIYIWYSHLDKIYLSNAFGPNHALNGTFGIHKKLLKNHRYDDTAMLAEESGFLNGFTTPVLQIDPIHSMLCISHSSNTYDKDFIMGSSTPVSLTLEDFVKDERLLAYYRRLSHAPTDMKVNWRVFQKIVMIYDSDESALLEKNIDRLVSFGMERAQIWPIKKLRNDDLAQAELITHYTILNVALEQGWGNVLILNSEIDFVKKESVIISVNGFLAKLPHLNWQALILGASYNKIIPLNSIPGVVRTRSSEYACSYAINGNYMSALRNAYRHAIDNGGSIEYAWREQMNQYLWLALYPSFAFLQRIWSDIDNKFIDCTHYFFRKHQ